MGLQDICNAAIEALHHPVGFGRPGLGQPVFYAERLAQLVKLMVATGLALSGCKEPIRELFPVVGQQLVDLDGQALCRALRKALALAALLLGLMATNTQRVALSMATNR